MFGFGNMFPAQDLSRSFSATYKCYSVSMLPGQEREDVEKGGKIIMPPSALDQLTRLNIQYPMLFKLTNKRTARDTHCGVLEFVADEGRIYLPYWESHRYGGDKYLYSCGYQALPREKSAYRPVQHCKAGNPEFHLLAFQMMRNLLLEEGGLVQLDSISLPIASFAKFQPQSEDFLDITNPKAVLENALRNFACLSAGDMVAIKYNDKIYELCVLQVEPGKAVSIIECDMNVDFAPPIGYVEPERVPRRHASTEEPMPVDASDYIDSSQFRAFSGQGVRLDGKTKNTEMQTAELLPSDIKRGIPDYNYKKGTLKFIRSPRIQNGTDSDKDKEDSFEPFTGSGQCLRNKGSRK